MIHVGHLHHVVHLAVVTESEGDVHQVVLILIDYTSLRIIFRRLLLVDLLYPLPDGGLELGDALVHGQPSYFHSEIFGGDFSVVDLLGSDILHGAEEGKHQEEQDRDKDVCEDNYHGDCLFLKRSRPENQDLVTLAAGLQHVVDIADCEPRLAILGDKRVVERHGAVDLAFTPVFEAFF